MCKAGEKNEGNRRRTPSFWVSSVLLVILFTSIISYFNDIGNFKDYWSTSLVASILIFGMAIAYWLDIILMDRRTNRKKTEERIGLDLLNWFRSEVNGAPSQKEGNEEKERKYIISSIRTYLEHVLIVFFLAFALAFFGSIEELMHIHMEGKCGSEDFCLELPDPDHIWIFVSYALLESSLVALLAIEFTTAFFVRHHEKSESLVASLIIAGVLDIAAFVLIKTVIAQPSIPLTDPGAGLGYIAGYQIAILLAGLMVLSFISSFGAINQAQIFVNDALDDHRNFLRISERLVTLSGGIYRNEKLGEISEGNTQSDSTCDESKNQMDSDVWRMEYISSNRARNTINVIIELSKPERYGGVDSEGISDSDERVG